MPCDSTQVNRLGDENGSLLERLQEAQAAVVQAAAAVDAADAEGSNGAAELAVARQVWHDGWAAKSVHAMAGCVLSAGRFCQRRLA